MLKILHIKLLLFKKYIYYMLLLFYYYLHFYITVINCIHIFKYINKIYSNIIDMLKKTYNQEHLFFKTCILKFLETKKEWS